MPEMPFWSRALRRPTFPKCRKQRWPTLVAPIFLGRRMRWRLKSFGCFMPPAPASDVVMSRVARRISECALTPLIDLPVEDRVVKTSSFRSEFSSIIRAQGIDALIAALNRKTETLAVQAFLDPKRGASRGDRQKVGPSAQSHRHMEINRELAP